MVGAGGGVVVDMQAHIDAMHRSAGEHLGCSEVAARVAGMLGGIDIVAGAFGAVANVAGFVDVATGARDAQRRGADAETARRVDLESRATSAATIAELLNLDTERIAASGSGVPSPFLTDYMTPPG